MLRDTSIQADLILGREFLQNEKLTLVYRPADKDEHDRANMFALLPLYVSEECVDKDELEQILKNTEISFTLEDKEKLVDVILNVQSQTVVPVDDDYSVQVRLRDHSTYAYAPRKFAYAERL